MFYKFSHIFVISLFFLASQFSFAQLKVGLQGGINISTYNIESKSEDAEITSKTGLIVGGVVNYSLNDQLEINSGLRYIQKGARVVFDAVGFQADNKINFNYLEMPVYLKYSFIKSSFKPFISVGFDLSYLLLANTKGTFDGNPVEDDITEQYDKFEVSLSGGLGLEYEASDIMSYVLSSNYSYAVIKGDKNLTNKGLQLTVSVFYKL